MLIGRQLLEDVVHEVFVVDVEVVGRVLGGALFGAMLLGVAIMTVRVFAPRRRGASVLNDHLAPAMSTHR